MAEAHLHKLQLIFSQSENCVPTDKPREYALYKLFAATNNKKMLPLKLNCFKFIFFAYLC
jgi:hypothetical protein